MAELLHAFLGEGALLENRAKKILIIDDDRDFCALAKSIGKSYNCLIDSFDSLGALDRLSRIKGYDAAIFDYHLEGPTGSALAEYAHYFFDSIPLFLISATPIDSLTVGSRVGGQEYLKFYSKSEGIENILKGVLDRILNKNILTRHSNHSQIPSKSDK